MEIKIRDYEDGWFGYNVIGFGENSAGFILPLIDQAIESGESEIKVFLNTIGGSVYDSLAIYNGLIRAKESGIKVITINEGICASAGTQIFMAGDERIVYTSLFMVHKPSIFACGSMDEDWLRKEMEALKVCQETISLTYAPTGLDEATLKSMLDEETWLTPALCKSLGFATEDKSSSEKANVPDSVTDMLQRASMENRAYAHKFLNISTNINKMNVQDQLKQVNDNSAKTNTLLTDLANWFKNDLPKIFKNEAVEVADEPVNASVQLENESYIYYEGALENGTSVYTDEAMTEACGNGDHTLMDGRTITVADGKVTAIAAAETQDEGETVDAAALQAENTALKVENEAANTALVTANEALNKANEALTEIKNLKSKYVPQDRQQDFSKAKDKTDPQPIDVSPEARASRKEARIKK